MPCGAPTCRRDPSVTTSPDELSPYLTEQLCLQWICHKGRRQQLRLGAAPHLSCQIAFLAAATTKQRVPQCKLRIACKMAARRAQLWRTCLGSGGKQRASPFHAAGNQQGLHSAAHGVPGVRLEEAPLHTAQDAREQPRNCCSPDMCAL